MKSCSLRATEYVCHSNVLGPKLGPWPSLGALSRFVGGTSSSEGLRSSSRSHAGLALRARLPVSGGRSMSGSMSHPGLGDRMLFPVSLALTCRTCPGGDGVGSRSSSMSQTGLGSRTRDGLGSLSFPFPFCLLDEAAGADEGCVSSRRVLVALLRKGRSKASLMRLTLT